MAPALPARFPLESVRALREGGADLAAAVQAAAGAHCVPVARLLAAAQSHPDLVAAPLAPRVCRGTSCELAGAARLDAALGAPRRAYCLGYCDRSPAALTADGGARVRCTPDAIRGAAAAPAPSLRCLAPEPIVLARLLRGDFSSLAAARADGAYQALARALSAPPEALIECVLRSGERGRGGAGFSTGEKWRACARAPGAQRIAIANGDEGDPGSFVDRALLELDPHAVLEGLALCAYAVGAREAIVFVRSEYPRAADCVSRALAEAERAELLGPRAAFPLALRVVRGFGSYVCGEETALIAALEGERAEARPRPPYPSERGLFGLPTVVNNVETLANVPWILTHGPEKYAALGAGASRGTKAFCLSAGFRAPGIVEAPFGISLRELIERGGETPCTRDALEGVLLGGPMGSFLRPEQCDLPLDLDALRTAGHELGHGGLVAVPKGADLAALARHLLGFMAGESCGRCTPCRVGSARAEAAFALRGLAAAQELDECFDAMEAASLCAFGRATPRPVRGLLAALAEAPR